MTVDAPGVTVGDAGPSSGAAATRVSRWSLRRRRGLLAVVIVAAGLTTGAWLYLREGGRLVGAGGSITAPVKVGEEFHTMAFLETRGGPIELVSAVPVGESEGARVEVALVDVGDRGFIGSSTGPLGPDYELLDIDGFHLDLPDADKGRHALDLRVVPEREGVHQVSAIAVTYRDGFLRERTATLTAPLCLLAFDDWTTIPMVTDQDCPLPE